MLMIYLHPHISVAFESADRRWWVCASSEAQSQDEKMTKSQTWQTHDESIRMLGRQSHIKMPMQTLQRGWDVLLFSILIWTLSQLVQSFFLYTSCRPVTIFYQLGCIRGTWSQKKALANSIPCSLPLAVHESLQMGRTQDQPVQRRGLVE